MAVLLIAPAKDGPVSLVEGGLLVNVWSSSIGTGGADEEQLRGINYIHPKFTYERRTSLTY